MNQPQLLSVSAIQPIFDVAERKAIIEAVVGAVRRSGAGRRVNPAKLAAALDSNFDRFLHGIRFDFGPILRSMRKDKQVSEADACEAAENVVEALKPFSLSVVYPKSTEARESASAKPRAIRLGELLVRNRVIAQAQLDRAIAAQKSVGGRLGTHLVTLGFVAEGALAHYLAMQLNVSAITPGALNGADIDTIRIIPSEVAYRHVVIALSLKHGVLRVAMSDPTNEDALAELARITGYRISAVVAPEGSIQAALDQRFGGRRVAKPRAISISTTPVDAGDFQVVHTARRTRKSGARANDLMDSGPSEPSIRVEDRGDFFQAERTDFNDEGGARDLSIQLTQAVDQEAVLKIVARSIARDFERTAVFLRRDLMVVGSEQIGCAIPEGDFKHVSFALADSTLLRTVDRDHKPHAAPEQLSALDKRLIASLGIRADSDITVVPICEGDSIIAYVLASGEPAIDPGARRESLDRVSEKAGLALELVSLKQRILDAA